MNSFWTLTLGCVLSAPAPPKRKTLSKVSIHSLSLFAVSKLKCTLEKVGKKKKKMKKIQH